MKRIIQTPTILLLGLLMFYLPSVSSETELDPGKAAPGFTLPDQLGMMHSLEDYAGTWLVLYFYPKDNTPGCTIEACNFREDIIRIRELGAEVVGISVDSIESHRRFAEAHRLPFPLLSDRSGEVAESYSALMDMGPVRLARRHTFIIDKQGKIAKIYRRVNPREHSDQVVRDLEELLPQ